MKSKPRVSPKKAPFDKYFYYNASVQAPDEDMRFLDEVYSHARGAKRVPKVMREDFCAAFANCCAWVKRGPDRLAYGVDLDPEPLEYGRQNYLKRLTADQQSRVKLLKEDVLSSKLPKADVICAQNFSYFIFKERRTLLAYFKSALRSLKDDGIFVLDCFGGTECQEANEEETIYEDEGFSYIWDQESYDPLTHNAVFHIHFKRRGEKRREKVFTYDWRMWTVPEIKDILLDAGFSKVNLYWEGTTDDGEGDGEYVMSEKGEECQSWVAYIVAVK